MTQLPPPADSLWAVRAQAMESAADHAERERAGWKRAAAEFLARFAASRATPWTAEECVAASSGTVPEPPDARAWGSVFNAASRAGVIVKAGYAARALNASPGVLWQGKERKE